MKGQKTFVSIVTVFFLLVLAVGLSQAQGPEGQEGQGPGRPGRILPAQGPVEPGGLGLMFPGDGGAGPLGALGTTAAVSSTFSYQGVLKEDGNPVTGDREMIFRLYANDACTATVGSPMTYTVPISNGLFHVSLVVNQADFNGQGLWLETEVAGVSIGCQPIQAVPYALSLRPGAVITADVPGNIPLTVQTGQMGADGSSGVYLGNVLYPVAASVQQGGLIAVYGVAVHDSFPVIAVGGESDAPGGAGVAGVSYYVTGAAYGGRFESDSDQGYGVYGLADANSGANYGGYFESDSTDGRGVYGFADASSGMNYGVYGRSDSASGYAGYFNNTNGGVDIAAAGSGIISSTADTQIAVSPLKMVLDPDLIPNPELRPESLGYITVRASGTGVQYTYLPVDLPSMVFGVDQKLKSIRICYALANASSFITRIDVYYADDTGSRTTLLSDTTDRTSTTWECFSVAAPTPLVIRGPVFVRFYLDFGGTGSLHDIQIGNTILTLTEQ